MGTLTKDSPCSEFPDDLVEIIWVYRPLEGGWKACSPTPSITSKLEENNIPSFLSLNAGEGFFLKARGQGQIRLSGTIEPASNHSRLPAELNPSWSLRTNPFPRTSLKESALPTGAKILMYRSGSWYSYPKDDQFPFIEDPQLKSKEGFFYFSSQAAVSLSSAPGNRSQFPLRGIRSPQETAFGVNLLDPENPLKLSSSSQANLQDAALNFSQWLLSLGAESLAIPPISPKGESLVPITDVFPASLSDDFSDLGLLEVLFEQLQPQGVHIMADLSPIASLPPETIFSISMGILESYPFDGIWISQAESGVISDLEDFLQPNGKMLIAQSLTPRTSSINLVEFSTSEIQNLLQEGIFEIDRGEIHLFSDPRPIAEQRNYHLFHSLRSPISGHWIHLSPQDYIQTLSTPGFPLPFMPEDAWGSLYSSMILTAPVAHINLISNKQSEQLTTSDLKFLLIGLGSVRELAFSMGYLPLSSETTPITSPGFSIWIYRAEEAPEELMSYLQNPVNNLLLLSPSTHASRPISAEWLSPLGIHGDLDWGSSYCPEQIEYQGIAVSWEIPEQSSPYGCLNLLSENLDSNTTSILSGIVGASERVYLYQKDNLFVWNMPYLPLELREVFAEILGMNIGKIGTARTYNFSTSAIISSTPASLSIQWNELEGNLRTSIYSDSFIPSPRILYPNPHSQSSYTLNAGTAELILFHPNRTPRAFAGEDIEVNGSRQVNIQGLGVDPEFDPLQYQWRQVSGTEVSLIPDAMGILSFQAPPKSNLIQELVFGLIASDSQSSSLEDTVSVRVFANKPPRVEISPVQTVSGGSLVTLTGIAEDSDDSVLQYLWSQTSGSPIIFSSPTSLSTSFSAPVKSISEQRIELLLEVSDSLSVVRTHTEVLIEPNIPPIVFTESIPSVPGKRTSTLLSSSFDPDGDPVSMTWSQTSGPPAILDNPHSLRPTFLAPDTEITIQLEFQVVGDDGWSRSEPAPLLVTITPTPTPACLDGNVAICIE